MEDTFADIIAEISSGVGVKVDGLGICSLLEYSCCTDEIVQRLSKLALKTYRTLSKKRPIFANIRMGAIN